MTLTKSQKIAFGLLAAGLVALGYDRFTGTAPAEETAEVTDNALTPASVSTGVAAPGAAAKSLPELLRGLVTNEADIESVADAFAPPASWFPAVAATISATPDERLTQFRAAHVLRAVVRSGRAGQAVVDGRLVRVGQSVDGWRLIAVSPQRATFADGPRRAVLALPDAPADVAASRPALPASGFSLTH